MSDRELVTAANRGDAEAMEALYERYRDWVVTTACRFTGDHALACDVLQEVFVYLLRKRPHLELRAEMKTFLYPAVRHLSLSVRRKHRREQGDAPEAVLDSGRIGTATDPESPLAEVVAGLSEAHREVLMLRFADELPLIAIARALDVPLGTVKSRLHVALTALRDDPRTSVYFEGA